MSVQTCFAKVKEYFEKAKRNVPDNVLREIAIALDAKRADSLGPAEFKQAVNELFASRLADVAAQKRAAAIISLEKAQKLVDVASQLVPGQSVVQNLEAIATGGSLRSGDSLNRSTARTRNALAAPWLEGLRSVLGENLKLAESGLLEREVTQEMADIEAGGKGGVSGSRAALEIAKAYRSVLDKVFEVKSAYDPFLGKIEDYYHRATHSREKVTAAGKEQWVRDALAAYGEKSFPELAPEQKARAFEGVYESIAQGRYLSILEGGPSGAGNLMQRMAQSRTLIPNDWESFQRYNAAYGQGNVHTTMLKTIERAAQDVAVLQKYGANPRQAFERAIVGAAKQFPDQAEAILRNKKQLMDKFEASTFVSDAPGYSNLAKFQRGMATVQQLAKSGKMVLRSIPDLVSGASALSDTTGQNFAGTFVELATEFSKRMLPGGGAGHEELGDMWMFARSALHNLYQEVGGEPQGFVSKMLQLHSWASLADRYHGSMSAAVGSIVERRLARMAEMEHSALPAETQAGLLRYGIKEPEWNLVRRAVEDWSKKSGEEFPVSARMLTPESIANLPDESVSAYLKKTGQFTGKEQAPAPAILRAKTDLSSMIGDLVNDHADIGTTTGGLKERVFMHRGTDPNSYAGAAFRFAWQFKSSVLKTYDSMMRSYYSNPAAPQGDFMKIARHLAFGTALWIFQDALGNLLQGKTPEDPRQGGYMAKAMLGSGAGGVLGDTLITEMVDSKSVGGFTEGVLKAFAGPSITTVLDIGGILARGAHSLQDPRVKFPANDLGRVIQQNVPFQNLFYTQAALNHYVLHGFREWLSPGFLGNLERRTVRTPGLLEERQRYFAFPPSEAIRYGH